MIKANVTELVHRWNELDEFASKLGGEDDPRFRAISEEMMDLEPLIIATPAQSEADVDAKRRFIRHSGYTTDDHRFETGDLADLVDTILRMDAERVVTG
jgi:hypothetical protein